MLEPFFSADAVACAQDFAGLLMDYDEFPIEMFRYIRGGGEPIFQDMYNELYGYLVDFVTRFSESELIIYANYLDSLVKKIAFMTARGDGHPSQAPETLLTHAMAFYLVSKHFMPRGRYLVNGIPADSRVLRQYPELLEKFSHRDHLLTIDSTTQLKPGWIAYRESDLQLHPFMRRGFGSRINNLLISLIIKQSLRGLDTKIAIDHYRLCQRGTLQQILELDRWFGAPFDSTRIDDPHHTPTVVHARTRAVGISPTDKPGLLTEFRWSYSDEIKSLEIEELPEPSTIAAGEDVLCRYIHTQRSIQENKFIHLDGAITIYNSAIYADRYRRAFTRETEKIWANSKPKMFRIDATERYAINDDDWLSIICSFYRGNELVLEYFAGKTFFEIYREEYGHEYPNFDSNE